MLKRAVVIVWNYIGAGQWRAFKSRLFEFHGDVSLLLLRPANGP